MTELIDAISRLAADQGIANVISLALIFIILNMQRTARAEAQARAKKDIQDAINTTAILNNLKQESQQNLELFRLHQVQAEDGKIFASILQSLENTAVEISDKSDHRQNENMEIISNHTEGVSVMKTELERVLTELAAMRVDMRELINTVTTKTSGYEARMKEVEETVQKITQETPAIPKSTEAKAEKEAANE